MTDGIQVQDPTEIVVDLMDQLHDGGMSNSELATHLGVSERTIRRWRRRDTRPILSGLMVGELRRIIDQKATADVA